MLQRRRSQRRKTNDEFRTPHRRGLQLFKIGRQRQFFSQPCVRNRPSGLRGST
ncbi:Uncharacterised protein [Mycobacteroides abscessus subsp. abscessus]|nr:Uncharacterised protein [Mycobacteroides abscessus subsp. abscessus]